MNYVFFGSPSISAIVLKRLIDAGMPPVALVCNPDRPAGRKKIITAPLTKLLVLESGLPISILQPEKLDADFKSALAALSPDFFVVMAYAKIIPASVLDIARVGTLGTHPSLLPKWRGASPIQSVLLAGETETGTTIYQMDAGMDSGGILMQKHLAIDVDDDNVSLEEKLANLSADALIEVMPQFYAGTIESVPQDAAQATFTKKFLPEDGRIENDDLVAAENGDVALAKLILQKIHAFNPEPGCWTLRNGKRVRLLKATIKNDRLVLLVTQEEGQKPKTH